MKLLHFAGLIHLLICPNTSHGFRSLSIGLGKPPRASVSSSQSRHSGFQDVSNAPMPVHHQKPQLPRPSSSLLLSPEALVLAETVAPKLGVVTANALYFAPGPAIFKAMKDGDIGDLNPFPVAIMTAVSLGWLAYGLSAQDIYVTLSNIFGSIGTIGFAVAVLPLLKDNKPKRRMTQAVLMAGTSMTLLLWTYLGLSGVSRTTISSMLGIFASALFIILSGSPLSTIKTVVATKNSNSIMGALTAAQVTNTALWTAYGLTVKDRFIWGPNSAGLILGLAQLALKLIFPSKKASKSKPLPPSDFAKTSRAKNTPSTNLVPKDDLET